MRTESQQVRRTASLTKENIAEVPHNEGVNLSPAFGGRRLRPTRYTARVWTLCDALCGGPMTIDQGGEACEV
jgi:hypothetical protein